MSEDLYISKTGNIYLDDRFIGECDIGGEVIFISRRTNLSISAKTLRAIADELDRLQGATP